MFYQGQLASPTAADENRLFNDLSQVMASPTPKSKPQKQSQKIFTDMEEAKVMDMGKENEFKGLQVKE